MTTEINDRRTRRSKPIKKTEELYTSEGLANVFEDGENDAPAAPVLDIDEAIATERANRRKKKALSNVDYDYQVMAVEYSKENIPQQLGNYRTAMDFLAHTNIINQDKIVDRLKKLIYDFPNVDISSFANKENAKLYSWIIQQMTYCMGEKYLGSMYVLGGGMGLLGAMVLDSKLRFETIRSFDINGTCQFLADEMMEPELLMDWRFKSVTQDLYDVDYAKHTFSCRLQNGSMSAAFKEVPGTVINTNMSFLKNNLDWYNMVPDLRRVVIVGETGDVPFPFSSSQSFNKRFPMSFELYTGVLKVDDKQFFMKIGHK
jgi:hypothetical protein